MRICNKRIANDAPFMRICNKRIAKVFVILYVDNSQIKQDMTEAGFLKCLKEYLLSTLLDLSAFEILIKIKIRRNLDFKSE